MKVIELKKATETLEAQNENGQFDHVINEMKVQLRNLQKAEREADEKAELEKRIKEEWGLTLKEYNDVICAFNTGENPTECAFEFNNKQLKLLAHKWSTDSVLYDVDGDFLTYNEAWDEVNNYPSEYLDLDEVIANNFNEIGEDEIYEKLLEIRDEEFVTDKDGNVIDVKNEVA